MNLSKTFLENSADTLRAIAHPYRIAMIEILFQNGQMTVTEIYQKLNIEQAVASHHLRILKNRSVVQVQRDGKNSLYDLTDKKYYEIIRTLTQLL